MLAARAADVPLRSGLLYLGSHRPWSATSEEFSSLVSLLCSGVLVAWSEALPQVLHIGGHRIRT